MGLIDNSPSSGESEVIETLHWFGASWSGIRLFRIGSLVSRRYGGDENREGSDPAWEDDVLTVLQALHGAGYVVGHDDTGVEVDLTSSPPNTTLISLTAEGRAYSRHPRPRPQRSRHGS